MEGELLLFDTLGEPTGVRFQVQWRLQIVLWVVLRTEASAHCLARPAPTWATGVHVAVFDEEPGQDDDEVGSVTVELGGLLRRPSFAAPESGPWQVKYAPLSWRLLVSLAGCAAAYGRRTWCTADVALTHPYTSSQADAWLELIDSRGRPSGEVHVSLHWAPREVTAKADEEHMTRLARMHDRKAKRRQLSMASATHAHEVLEQGGEGHGEGAEEVRGRGCIAGEPHCWY